MYISDIRFRATHMTAPAFLVIPFQEVRHQHADDCLHHELIESRGRSMNWIIPAHHHEGLHQLLFLVKGEVQGSIDGKPFHYTAPTLFLLAPGSVHQFSYTSTAVGHQLTLPTATIEQLDAGSRFLQDNLNHSFVIDQVFDPDRLLLCFETLSTEFHSSQPGRLHAMLAYAKLILITLIRNQRRLFAQADASMGDTLLRRFMNLLDQDYALQLTLEHYAHQLGVTTDHLSRVCRHLTGQSGQKLIQEKRLLESRRLLAYTEMSIKEIAYQLGFSSPAYFSRYFSQGCGLSAQAYRKQVKQGLRR